MTQRLNVPGLLPELPPSLRNGKDDDLRRFLEALLRSLNEQRVATLRLIDESNKRA